MRSSNCRVQGSPVHQQKEEEEVEVHQKRKKGLGQRGSSQALSLFFSFFPFFFFFLGVVDLPPPSPMWMEKKIAAKDLPWTLRMGPGEKIFEKRKSLFVPHHRMIFFCVRVLLFGVL